MCFYSFPPVVPAIEKAVPAYESDLQVPLTVTQKLGVSLPYPAGCREMLFGELRPGGMYSMIRTST